MTEGDADPAVQAAIETMIFALLAKRQEGATLCPSDVARALATDASQWRSLMPLIRRVAQHLARQGRLHVTRRGAEVDATSRGGPIRLGRPPV
jgi:hypothetical protein